MALFLFYILSVLAFVNAQNPDQTGGSVCVGCVVIIRTIDQDALQNEQTIEKAVMTFCDSYFDGTWVETICDKFILTFGSEIITYLVEDYTPDEVCQELHICGNKTCNLYPPSKEQERKISNLQETKLKSLAVKVGKILESYLNTPIQPPASLNFNPIDYIEEIIQRVFGKHEPLIDLDGDLFSTIETFRGSDWRGKDCDDENASIYPGRKTRSSTNPNVDHNCNGIYGADPQTGKDWEDILCGNSQPRGVMVLGDSAAAHFSVPFPNPYLNQTSPQDFAHMLENELDWPACSWSTGHWDTKYCPYSPLTSGVDSIYLQLWKRNHCNHRDYQTIAVNGARSTAMNSTIVKSIQRNQETDNPLLVFYALVGNDVCNPHAGYDHMTTPDEFYKMITSTMQYLDTHLPYGSHVFFIGLEAGDLIWPTMHNQMHPLGVDYERLWDFVSCLGVNPCWGWLQDDSAVRNYTSQRAEQLNQVFPKIIANQKYKHFEMHYLGNFMRSNFNNWVKEGGNPVDFFEIVGGGHPSQLAQELDAAAIWNELITKYPDALGPINPNNQLIEKMFGDQGGYD